MLDAMGNVVLLSIVGALCIMGVIDAVMLVATGLAGLWKYVRGKGSSGKAFNA